LPIFAASFNIFDSAFVVMRGIIAYLKAAFVKKSMIAIYEIALFVLYVVCAQKRAFMMKIKKQSADMFLSADGF